MGIWSWLFLVFLSNKMGEVVLQKKHNRCWCRVVCTTACFSYVCSYMSHKNVFDLKKNFILFIHTYFFLLAKKGCGSVNSSDACVVYYNVQSQKVSVTSRSFHFVGRCAHLIWSLLSSYYYYSVAMEVKGMDRNAQMSCQFEGKQQEGLWSSLCQSVRRLLTFL